MKEGRWVFIIAFIATIMSYNLLFTELLEPGKTFAAIGIGIMVAISFIKK